MPGELRRLFVNERLTRLNRQLFGMAREAASRAQRKYVRTRNDDDDMKRNDLSRRENELSIKPAIPLPPPPGLSGQNHHPSRPVQGNQAANINQSTFISFPEINENSDTATRMKNMQFANKTIRHGFIRKVYTIVMAQLLFTGLIIFGFIQAPSVGDYAREHFWTVFAAPLIVYFTTFFCILCCEGPRRRVPCNYIFLLLFTASLAVMVGITATRFRYEEILIAAGITFVIFLALTLFACQTRFDFTILNGCGLCILLILLLFGTAMLATSYDRLRLVYTTIGVLVISVYIVCDTQMIVGGSHRYSISPEEYVFAALVLYLDVMNLFLRILRLLR
ncbi:unnamed protein product, partial [Iphiclides podalirius]